MAGGDSASYIAKWNGSSWSPLGSGITGSGDRQVNTLTVYNNELIVGGIFGSAGGVSAGNIAKWNGSAWSSIGGGTNGNGVLGLEANSNSLFVGGQFTMAGTTLASNIARWGLATGIKAINENMPFKYTLSQNYPNPFNPSTLIKFAIPRASSVKISVFDVSGRALETPVNEYIQPGTYQIQWNAENYPSGVYFYKIQTDDFTETKRMILLK
jgi:hypothetical protein